MGGLRSGPGARREASSRRRTMAWGAVRVIGSCAGLLALYYGLPLDRSLAWAAFTLSIGLVLFIALVGFQVRSIVRSPFPAVRAVEALATSVPFFLLLFAGTYYVLARDSAGSFAGPLTRTDALYFTVTVFSTVGFGDITATSQLARLVVTGQIIADLVILGIAIKIIVGAVKTRRPRPVDLWLGTRPGPASRFRSVASEVYDPDICQAVECELHRQRGEQEAEYLLGHQHPACVHVIADLDGPPEDGDVQGKYDDQDAHHDGEHRYRACLGRGGDEDDDAGRVEQVGDCEREDGSLHRVPVLVPRAAAVPAILPEHHSDRDDQQDDAAGDAQCPW